MTAALIKGLFSIIALYWMSSSILVAAQKQRSLVIIFDVTSSMEDDMEDMKAGAHMLAEKIANAKNKPVENFILVPFTDPLFGPVMETSDPKEIQNIINGLRINNLNNTDCEEMSLSALQAGLQRAHPESFVYVFTDAESKDNYLLNNVIQLAQEKRSPVNFIVAADTCEDEDPSYDSYYKIANATNGMVNQITSDETIKIVAEITDNMDQDHGTVNVIQTAPGTHRYPFDVDASTVLVRVMITGAGSTMKFIDPSNKESKSNTTLHLIYVRVQTVSNPKPGRWYVEVSADTVHQIKITISSMVQLEFGFDLQKPKSMENLEKLPTEDRDNYFAVALTKESKEGVKLEFVTFFTDKENQRVPLEYIKEQHMWVAKFKPPHGTFKIRVNGKDEFGNTFERLLPTGFIAKPPPLTLNFVTGFDVQKPTSLDKVTQMPTKDVENYFVVGLGDGSTKGVNLDFVIFVSPTMNLKVPLVYDKEHNFWVAQFQPPSDTFRATIQATDKLGNSFQKQLEVEFKAEPKPSPISIQIGFDVQKPENLDHLHQRPIKDRENYIVLGLGKNTPKGVILEYVTIKTPRGTTKIPLEFDKEKNYFYGKFTPPIGPFEVVIHGKDENKKDFEKPLPGTIVAQPEPTTIDIGIGFDVKKPENLDHIYLRPIMNRVNYIVLVLKKNTTKGVVLEYVTIKTPSGTIKIPLVYDQEKNYYFGKFKAPDRPFEVIVHGKDQDKENFEKPLPAKIVPQPEPTPITVEIGFDVKKPDNLQNLHPAPIIGRENYIVLVLNKNTPKGVVLEYVAIKTPSGTMKIPLLYDQEKNYFYGKFTPPNGPFEVVIHGKDQDNNHFETPLPSEIVPQPEPAPIRVTIGFDVKKPDNLQNLHPAPTIGRENYIVVVLDKNTPKGVVLEYVAIKTPSGTIKIPLLYDAEKNYFYGKFTPPNGPFEVVIHGKDQDNNHFETPLPSEIVPQPEPAPIRVTIGFDVKKPENVNEIQPRPILGKENYIVLVLNRETPVGVVLEYVIMKTSGGSIRIPLVLDQEKLYYYGKFKPHDAIYEIVIHGKDANGNNFEKLVLTNWDLKPQPDNHQIVNLVDGSAELHCLVRNMPKATINWYKNGALLDTHEVILTVKSPGYYHCVATNGQGSQLITFEVDIHRPPGNDRAPKVDESRLTRENNSLIILHPTDNTKNVIVCPIVGHRVKIDWFTDIPNFKDYEVSADGQTMTLKQAFTGVKMIGCKGTNIYGQVILNYRVTHNQENTIGNGGNEIYNLETDSFDTEIHAKYGQDVVLYSYVVAHPAAHHQWYEVTQKGNYISSGQKSSLTIKKITENKHFVVVAENSVGKVTKNYYVIVDDLPQLLNPNPKCNVVNVGPQMTVTLKCEAKNPDNMRYTWYKLDGHTQPQHMNRSISSDLKITNMSKDHAGVYVCKVTNSVGSATKEFNVVMANVVPASAHCTPCQ